MAMPRPVRLFHITAIENLAGICEKGALVCKNQGSASGINYQNIAHSGAQGRRSAKEVPLGGTVHDYVPFYFAPRSPMLYAINVGNVSGCDLRQADILHFETTAEAIYPINQELFFYDRNATLDWSVAYTDLKKLHTEVAWDLLTEVPRLDGFCQYFHDIPENPRYVDRRERRQAEFLVKDSISLDCMRRIGVYNEEKAEIVRSILDDHSIALPVQVMAGWYF